ncbi:alkaline phosphatase [Planctomycetota bacterium]
MHKKNTFVILLFLFCLVLFAGGCEAGIKTGELRNVILFIGDGMGPEQVRAAGLYAHGEAGTLFMESLPYQTEMTTDSAGGKLTDSAASATAIATGEKVNNGVISMAIPGDERELKTLLEYFQEAGKSTGLVTTVPMFHATPAAFGAHDPKRGNKEEIIDDYLNQTRPEVLLGGGKNGITPKEALEAGYVVVQNAAEMLALDTESVEMVSGQFAGEIPYEYDGVGELPHLTQMTETALAILDNDADGFFLMVEGGKIDWASHNHQTARMIGETMEFDRAVKAAWEWARGRGDTLIVVTADHETGGLTVERNNGQGVLPEVSWSTKGHTPTEVPVYAWGTGAELFTEPMDNTHVFYKIISAANLEVEAAIK